MHKKLVFIILSIWLLSSCSSPQQEIVSNEEIVIETQGNSHIFEKGEHVFWSNSFKNNILTFTIELAPTWKTYSQYNKNFIGPLPTIFTFEASDNYELDGEMEEVYVKSMFDKEANQELSYFEGKGVFTQKIKIKSGKKFVLKGNINFMTCNEKGCEPPSDYPFEIEITP